MSDPLGSKCNVFGNQKHDYPAKCKYCGRSVAAFGDYTVCRDCCETDRRFTKLEAENIKLKSDNIIMAKDKDRLEYLHDLDHKSSDRWGDDCDQWIELLSDLQKWKLSLPICELHKEGITRYSWCLVCAYETLKSKNDVLKVLVQEAMKWPNTVYSVDCTGWIERAKKEVGK